MAFTPENKQYNYFYRITNQINWKYYFGIHSTNDLNDGYFGSSKSLKLAIKKHGKENFIKVIIANYPTRKEANEHERLVVDLDMVNNPMCYNLRTGGDNEFIISDEIKAHISKKTKGRKLTTETRLKISESLKGNKNPFYGKHHTDETKRKLSEANSGENAFNFGRKFSDLHRQKIGDGNRGRIASEESKEKRRITIANNPKPISEERKQFLTDLLRKHNKNARKCLICGIEYDSISAVARNFGISNKVAKSRIKSEDDEWVEWKYISESNISEETRQKHRTSKLGSKHTNESKSKMGLSGELNGFFGRVHSETTRQHLQENCPNRKPCVIEHEWFPSIKDAARKLNIPVTTIRSRLKSKNSKFKDWNYE